MAQPAEADPFARRREIENSRRRTAVKVTFTTKVELNFGEKLYVVGSHKALGNNDTRRGRRMELVDGAYRTMPFEVEAGVNQIEYRYLKVHDASKNEHWETAAKRVLDIPHDTKSDLEQNDLLVKFA